MSIMATIIMGKREIEEPAIHITNAFRGSCFQGPMATLHPSYIEREREGEEEREREREREREGAKERG